MKTITIIDHKDGTYSAVWDTGKTQTVYEKGEKRRLVLELAKVFLSFKGEYKIVNKYGDK